MLNAVAFAWISALCGVLVLMNVFGLWAGIAWLFAVLAGFVGYLLFQDELPIRVYRSVVFLHLVLIDIAIIVLYLCLRARGQ